MIRIVLFLFAALPLLAAASGTTPDPTPIPAPGGGTYLTNPLAFFQDFYNLSLALGGLLAFGIIVYAGVEYALARGNPGTQSDAKDRITQALLGLVLLLSAFMIVRFVDPTMLTINLPEIGTIIGAQPAGAPGSKACPEKCAGNTHCVQGSCQPTICSNCDISKGNSCQWVAGVAQCVAPQSSGNRCAAGNKEFSCKGYERGGCPTPCTSSETCTPVNDGFWVCSKEMNF